MKPLVIVLISCEPLFLRHLVWKDVSRRIEALEPSVEEQRRRGGSDKGGKSIGRNKEWNAVWAGECRVCPCIPNVMVSRNPLVWWMRKRSGGTGWGRTVEEYLEMKNRREGTLWVRSSAGLKLRRTGLVWGLPLNPGDLRVRRWWERDAGEQMRGALTWMKVRAEPDDLHFNPRFFSSSPHSAGVGRTGVFLTLAIVLDRMRYEGVVDMFQTVKMLRTQRPAMVQTEDQYQFCYASAIEYLNSFDHYATDVRWDAPRWSPKTPKPAVQDFNRSLSLSPPLCLCSVLPLPFLFSSLLCTATGADLSANQFKIKLRANPAFYCYATAIDSLSVRLSEWSEISLTRRTVGASKVNVRARKLDAWPCVPLCVSSSLFFSLFYW